MVLIIFPVCSEKCTCLRGLVGEKRDRDIAVVSYHEDTSWLSQGRSSCIAGLRSLCGRCCRRGRLSLRVRGSFLIRGIVLEELLELVHGGFVQS
jgi:hypothetical protein